MRPSFKAARDGTLPSGAIENRELRLEGLKSDVSDEAGDQVLDLCWRLPEVRITDLLLDADGATGFADAFTHLRTGVPCKDRIGLLNVILAEGLNLSLSKFAPTGINPSKLQSPSLGQIRALKRRKRLPEAPEGMEGGSDDGGLDRPAVAAAVRALCGPLWRNQGILSLHRRDGTGTDQDGEGDDLRRVCSRVFIAPSDLAAY